MTPVTLFAVISLKTVFGTKDKIPVPETPEVTTSPSIEITPSIVSVPPLGFFPAPAFSLNLYPSTFNVRL